MKAYRIKELKNFMGKLLATEAFDDFLLAEAAVTTYNTFTIDGHIVKDFFSGDAEHEDQPPAYDFSAWQDMRGLIFDLIKGRRTPVQFKLVLHLMPQRIDEILKSGGSDVLLPDIKAFVLNIRYEGGILTCITATAFHSFLPDKTPDKLWDEYLSHFLDQKGISFEEE